MKYIQIAVQLSTRWSVRSALLKVPSRLTDWRGRVHGSSPIMLVPASTAEVVEIVRLAAELRVPLVPQGGNTGMAAGASCARACCSMVLLSLDSGALCGARGDHGNARA